MAVASDIGLLLALFYVNYVCEKGAGIAPVS
nr:MAG TPA: hypothetical protein [Caudoviricetes sp.]